MVTGRCGEYAAGVESLAGRWGGVFGVGMGCCGWFGGGLWCLVWGWVV
jgi:hypothetical protein